jgi:prepilin-type N-terminal cleavage/methylation domain-containing protein
MLPLHYNSSGPRARRRCPFAFSLIELLTVIAVVAVLASLVFVGAGKVRNTAMKSKAGANMRQIGIAVLTFANEHGGTLPGPSGLGLVPYYDASRPYPRTTELAACIAPYLSVPIGSTGNNRVYVEELICPAASALTDTSNGSLPPPYFIQNYTLPIPRGRIFGAQQYGNSEATNGWMLSRIQELGKDASIWMITNLDQKLPSDMPASNNGQVRSSGWFSRLPEEPVWGETRLRLYLDGHVAEVPRDAEP